MQNSEPNKQKQEDKTISGDANESKKLRKMS